MANKVVVITGTSSGLGSELAHRFGREMGWMVAGIDRDEGVYGEGCVDLSDTMQIVMECGRIEKKYKSVDLLINCAGVNTIDYIEDLSVAQWNIVMNVNARAPFLMVKCLLPALRLAHGTVCNIISNASHVPMTSSLAYNASKGALHIMTLQMARELYKRHHITVLGLSPNKMSGTGMTRYIDERVPELRGWTPEQAHQYQLNSLPIGKETPPEAVADFLFWLLSEKSRHEYLHGCILPYGG